MPKLLRGVRTLLVAVGLAAFVVPGTGAAAQEFTLSVWAEDVWLDILDREGTIRGALAEEGIFQRFHPDMDHEYQLDVRTGLFTAAEDARWAESGRGVRAAAASISDPHLITQVDWREAYPIAGPVELTVEYRRDHSLTDRRDYPRLGVRWRDVGGSGWTAWSRMGVHFFKPAADLEVGAVRSWPVGDHGGWRLELVAAALDALSDAVFVGLGVDPEEVEAHVDYEAPPLAGRVRLQGRGRWWSLELHGGATTTVRGRITFPGTGEDPFDLTEGARFAGALVELAPTPRFTAAAYGRVAEAETRHTWAPEALRRLRVDERTEAVGGYARHRIDDVLSAEAELHGVWRPETRVNLEGVLEHEDREVYGALSLVRRPTAGWTGRLAWTALDRDAGVLLPGVTARNHRLVTEAGYRTASGFRVTGGFRWDLDRSGEFDGAQLRLSVLPGGESPPAS